MRQNGLIGHILQTGFRHTLNKPFSNTYKEFITYASHTNETSRPKHIIYILCEACWHNKDFFQEQFKPLLYEGFVPLRGISPIYGGGTVNAEFEMYTALPALGTLNGIIYQEYHNVISKETSTIIASLHKKGYGTVALHNNVKQFWKRDIVLPKLGFNEFIGIDEMNYDGKDQFPKDQLLYDKALVQFSSMENRPFFFALSTMATHGPYPPSNGDMGVTNYKNRIQLAVAEMAAFIKEVKHRDPNVFIMVYGDHKPSLNEFFSKHKILDMNKENDSNVLGDVPIYLYYHDKARLEELIRVVNHKPFYCVTAGVDQEIMHSGASASSYVYQNVCLNTDKTTYKKVPEWLYYWTLFA